MLDFPAIDFEELAESVIYLPTHSVSQSKKISKWSGKQSLTSDWSAEVISEAGGVK